MPKKARYCQTMCCCTTLREKGLWNWIFKKTTDWAQYRESYLNRKGLSAEAFLYSLSRWDMASGKKHDIIDTQLTWSLCIFSITCAALQARCSSIRGSTVCEQGLQCLPRYLYREGGPADGAKQIGACANFYYLSTKARRKDQVYCRDAYL